MTVPRPAERKFALDAFTRASLGHIGAAAAAASLRSDLVGGGLLSGDEFDRAYAIARLTPGTNLLALYALLGHRLGGWTLALRAVAVGTVAPAALAVAFAGLYVFGGHSPVALRAMQGARAGALAVFVWGIIRLLGPQLRRHPVRGGVLATAALLMVLVFPGYQLALLGVAAGIGAMTLRSDA